MDKLVPFTINELAKITNHRSGEVKFGEKMHTAPRDSDPFEFMVDCEAPYVLLGIPEDIGVRANSGRPGAASAWQSALSAIANIQHNKFCKGDSIFLLGHLDYSIEMASVNNLKFKSINDRKQLYSLVEKIDRDVSHVVSMIVKAGKIPIVIGGGHNNSYGNIKGTALAKGQQVNAINFDAHSDFRIMEGRHSGNGFSYAFEEGFLKRYFIFGLHESYTSKSVLNTLKKTPEAIKYNTYDQIRVRKQKGFEREMEAAYDFIKSDAYGIEIDLDAIPGVASSAMTLSGFSVEELRRFVTFFGKGQNASYIHICEGAPDLGDEKTGHLVGKLIGYLVTDFVKANATVNPQMIERETLKKDSAK